MPIYEYRCSSCGHELEALQKFSDAMLRTCPSCRSDALVKLMSASGFQLKGSGWYATDFKGSGSKPAQTKVDGESKPGPQSDSKGEAAGKTESKGEGKSEAKSETANGTKTPAAGTGVPPAST